MLSYLGLKGRSKELIWRAKGFAFKEFKFEEERNGKPVLQHPFQSWNLSIHFSQLTKSLSLRNSRQVEASQGKPTGSGTYWSSALRDSNLWHVTGSHIASCSSEQGQQPVAQLTKY